MYVIKRDGKKERFNKNKIIRSCMRAGATKEICKDIVNVLQKELYDGISTQEIRLLILKELSRKKEKSARRYRNYKK